jgi:hypothetical protein
MRLKIIDFGLNSFVGPVKYSKIKKGSVSHTILDLINNYFILELLYSARDTKKIISY